VAVVVSVLAVAVGAGLILASQDTGRSARADDLARPAPPARPPQSPTVTAALIMREVTVPMEAAAPALRTSALTPVPPPPTPTAASGQRSAPGSKVAKRPAARVTGDKAGSTRSTGSSAPRCVVPAGARASQVLVVRSSGTRATVRACSRTTDGSYRTDLGPYSGYVGRSGVTSAASKREGDGATPAGVYPLRGGFGLKSNPGIPQGWFRVDSRDVWVDDPKSTLYNTHQRKPADGRWSSAESLANAPAYDYAQVIGYNEARRPGRGSAIFLHVATGGPTAGCVSLPRAALLEVMRWERSGAVIAIS
jgi:L,D-peptidoglycan transpeptidase YkuD (ErfK/YbiS/YcfS/YnhG family)